jgi:hypothetical protein
MSVQFKNIVCDAKRISAKLSFYRKNHTFAANLIKNV